MARHSDTALDEALTDTFPASDPIACSNPTTTTRRTLLPPAAQSPQPAGATPHTPWFALAMAFLVGYFIARRYI